MSFQQIKFLPQVGDKIVVKTKNGRKICIIDSVTKTKIHFKNKSGFELEVNAERVLFKQTAGYGAFFEYTSFN